MARYFANFVLIKPASGQTFADILRGIRTNVKPEESGAVVRSIRQTRTGGILVELDEKTRDKPRLARPSKKPSVTRGQC